MSSQQPADAPHTVEPVFWWWEEETTTRVVILIGRQMIVTGLLTPTQFDALEDARVAGTLLHADFGRNAMRVDLHDISLIRYTPSQRRVALVSADERTTYNVDPGPDAAGVAAGIFEHLNALLAPATIPSERHVAGPAQAPYASLTDLRVMGVLGVVGLLTLLPALRADELYRATGTLAPVSQAVNDVFLRVGAYPTLGALAGLIALQVSRLVRGRPLVEDLVRRTPCLEVEVDIIDVLTADNDDIPVGADTLASLAPVVHDDDPLAAIPEPDRVPIDEPAPDADRAQEVSGGAPTGASWSAPQHEDTSWSPSSSEDTATWPVAATGDVAPAAAGSDVQVGQLWTADTGTNESRSTPAPIVWGDEEPSATDPLADIVPTAAAAPTPASTPVSRPEISGPAAPIPEAVDRWVPPPAVQAEPPTPVVDHEPAAPVAMSAPAPAPVSAPEPTGPATPIPDPVDRWVPPPAPQATPPPRPADDSPSPSPEPSAPTPADAPRVAAPPPRQPPVPTFPAPSPTAAPAPAPVPPELPATPMPARITPSAAPAPTPASAPRQAIEPPKSPWGDAPAPAWSAAPEPDDEVVPPAVADRAETAHTDSWDRTARTP